jgi:hypothetical protein
MVVTLWTMVVTLWTLWERVGAAEPQLSVGPALHGERAQEMALHVDAEPAGHSVARERVELLLALFLRTEARGLHDAQGAQRCELLGSRTLEDLSGGGVDEHQETARQELRHYRRDLGRRGCDGCARRRRLLAVRDTAGSAERGA